MKFSNFFQCFKKNKIDEFTNDNIKLFSYNGFSSVVKIVDVYDGDTFTGVFQYRNEIIKYKFRCFGYDSPEMKPLLKTPNRDNVIENAKIARQKFIELSNCNKKFVFVEFGEFDKYGRILAKVYTKDKKLYVNGEMIKGGFGYEYFGGTKKKS